MLSWGEYLAYGAIEAPFLDGDAETEKRFDPRMYPSGINADFFNVKGKSTEEFVADFKSKFEIPENRDIALCKDELMVLFQSVADIKPGSTIVDFGSGTGLFLKLFSDAVGSTGHVVATEVSDNFIQLLTDICKQENLTNVRIVKSTNKSMNLESYASTVDAVVICDVYHHLEFPRTLMRQIRNILKPVTGRLIIVDFIRDNDIHKSHPKDWIMQHVRAGQAAFRREVVSCGFQLVCEPSIKRLEENYIMVFKPCELTVVGAGWGQSKRAAMTSLPSANNSKTTASTLPPGFVYLDEMCSSIRTSARYCSCENFLGTRVEGYNVPRIVLTKEAATALAAVQAAVAIEGYSLLVYDGYRPQRAVNHFVRWSENPTDQKKKMEYYPEVDKADLFDLGYIAKRSGHSRGSTVDLTLIANNVICSEIPRISMRSFQIPDGSAVSLPFLDDNSVDMGTSFDMLGVASHDDCKIIPQPCQEMRAYLKQKMNDGGFVEYSQEWWHFTLRNEPFPDTYFDFEIK